MGCFVSLPAQVEAKGYPKDTIKHFAAAIDELKKGVVAQQAEYAKYMTHAEGQLTTSELEEQTIAIDQKAADVLTLGDDFKKGLGGDLKKLAS